MDTIFKSNDRRSTKQVIEILRNFSDHELSPLLPAIPLFITEIGHRQNLRGQSYAYHHGSEHNILIYCVHGAGHITVDNHNFEIKNNQYIIIPVTKNYLRYWADQDKSWTIYWVCFAGLPIKIFNDYFHVELGRGPIPINLNEEELVVWNDIITSFSNGLSRENVLHANFRLYQLLSIFLFPSKHPEVNVSVEKNLISKAILTMEKNLNNRLSVDELAKGVGLSSTYFSTAFKKSKGLPPIEYFIQMKMKKACELIKTGNYKMNWISRKLGYDDPYYFSRSFKRVVGVSPIQFRNGLNARTSVDFEEEGTVKKKLIAS